MHALIQSFELDLTPVKSSLSKYRNKISSLFFKDILFELLSSFKRSTWKGLHLYATDGFQLAIPRTKDTLEQGYRGHRLKTESGRSGETYYPHMYTVHTYDILSRTTKAVSVLLDNHEVLGATLNIQQLERNSLTLYDRGFCSYKIMRLHFEKKNYFFIRYTSGKSTPKEIKEFVSSNRKRDSYLFENKENQRIYLYKVQSKKKKEVHIYATNYGGLNLKEAEELYRLRWEVENGFRDLVTTLPTEQWHSKTENGILQELYVRLWVMNFARIEQFKHEKSKENPLNKIYKRSNFKLILDFIIKSWGDYFAGKRTFLQKIKKLIKISTETRKRYSRSCRRKLRYQNKNYPAANIVFDPLEVVVA